MDLKLGIGLRTELDIQLELREALEASLHDIREVTKLKINDQLILKKEIINIYSELDGSLDRLLLDKALDLGLEAHKGQYRENGDPYIVHPFQVGYIIARVAGDIDVITAGILHDAIEENYTRKDDISNKICKYLGSAPLELVYQVTSKPIENPILKKQLLSEKIEETSRKDRLKKAYLIKVSDRIANLLSLEGLTSKYGVASKYRREIIIADTRKNILQLAKEIDRIYHSDIQLYPYLRDILEEQITKNL